MKRNQIKKMYEDNFTPDAQKEVKDSVEKYKKDLITKAYEIKNSETEKKDHTITYTHVKRAEEIFQKKRRPKKITKWLKGFEDLLAFFIGLFFDLEKIQADTMKF